MKELDQQELAERLKKSPKKAVEPVKPIPAPVSGAPVLCPGCRRDWHSMDMPFNTELMRCAECVSADYEKTKAGGANGADGSGFRVVPAAHLIPREDNPRRIDVKADSFRALVASICSAGIITPLIGRPHPERPECVELLAGHRRRLAGLEADLTEFPVIVRAMDDRTAMEVLVFENLDRENLTPLEEARGVQLMLNSGHDGQEIASRMGKTVQWVARRRQLLQLTAAWKQWAEEWNISAAHLELVARLERAVQDELFDVLTRDEYNTQECFFEPGSLSKLRARINDELRELKLAPWALDNAVLCPKAGACSVCPKRSGCQPDLFSDPEDAGDRCLDKKCWEEKRTAYQKQREAEMRKEHKDLVMVVGKDAPWQEADEVRKRGALQSWQFTECKKSAEGAVPALIVCGKGEGSLTWVKPAAGGAGKGTREQAAKPSAAAKQAAASLNPAESAKLLAEKQEAHEQRRWAWVAKHLQEALDESNLPTAEEFRTPEGLLRLARVFGAALQDNQAMWVEARERTWKKLRMPFGVETLEAVWQQMKPAIRMTLEVYKVSDVGPWLHAGIEGAAMLLGREVPVLKAMADEAIPEPKAWEQLRKLAEAPAPKSEPAKPANESRPPEWGKEPYDYRMCDAATANEGRGLIKELEEEIEKLQKAHGVKPTVGQVEENYFVGFSTVKQKEWEKSINALTKKNAAAGETLSRLVYEGTVMLKHFERLLEKEQASYKPDGKETSPSPKKSAKKKGQAA